MSANPTPMEFNQYTVKKGTASDTLDITKQKKGTGKPEKNIALKKIDDFIVPISGDLSRTLSGTKKNKQTKGVGSAITTKQQKRSQQNHSKPTFNKTHYSKDPSTDTNTSLSNKETEKDKNKTIYAALGTILHDHDKPKFIEYLTIESKIINNKELFKKYYFSHLFKRSINIDWNSKTIIFTINKDISKHFKEDISTYFAYNISKNSKVVDDGNTEVKNNSDLEDDVFNVLKDWKIKFNKSKKKEEKSYGTQEKSPNIYKRSLSKIYKQEALKEYKGEQRELDQQELDKYTLEQREGRQQESHKLELKQRELDGYRLELEQRELDLQKLEDKIDDMEETIKQWVFKDNELSKFIEEVDMFIGTLFNDTNESGDNEQHKEDPNELSADELPISNYVNEIMEEFNMFATNGQKQTPSTNTKKNQVVTKNNHKEEGVVYRVAKTDYLAIFRDKISREINKRAEDFQLMLERMKKKEEEIKNKQSNDK